MADERNVRIFSNERVFLCGKTGSGKTYAAERLLRRLPRVIVLDPKGDDEGIGKWGLVPWDREARRLLRTGEPVRARVTIDPRRPAEEVWDEALAAALNAGDCTVYVDEVYGIVDPGSKPSPLLTAIWTRGRSLGVGGWAASQRPVWVPLFFLSEAEHFFVFRLTVMEDRDRMSKFMGPPVLDTIRDRHGFYYMQAEWDEPLYIESFPDGRGAAE